MFQDCPVGINDYNKADESYGYDNGRYDGSDEPFTIGDSGDYGWNDGSAEAFWDYVPITSGINNITDGVNNGSGGQITWGLVTIVIDALTFGEGSVGIKATETYVLKATESGLYPVMTRGFKNSTSEIFLNAGDVWKFGTTKNPFSRYTNKFLETTGNGLYYETLSSGTLIEALQQEKTHILNYIEQTGGLPAGNKIIK